MNFYIFNFSKINYLKYFTIIFMTFLVLNILLDILLQIYIDRKTTKTSFVEEKFSKSTHMKLQNNIKDMDYIFVGDSRTAFGISTYTFKKQNINIYNFGVSGSGIKDYGYMVDMAIEEKPKNIIIALGVDELFRGEIIGDNNKGMSYIDLAYIFKTQPFSIFYNALISYIKNQHILLNYSEPIYLRLKQFYSTFDIKPNTLKVDKKNKKRDEEIQLDCKVFSYNYPSEDSVVGLCTNGDGVLISNKVFDLTPETIKLEKISSHYINYLNLILDKISNEDINAIVVFQSNYNNLIYDIYELKKDIHSKQILDLSNVILPNEFRLDSVHLNNDGRIMYTNKLLNILQERNYYDK